MEAFVNAGFAALVISGVTQFLKGRVPINPIIVAPVVAFGFNLVGAWIGANDPRLAALAAETMVEAMAAVFGYSVVREGIKASGINDIPPDLA